MASVMKIDQVGLPAGTDGRSRSDGLATGALVTLTAITAGTTHKFELLWVPPGDVNAVASLAATGVPSVWTFTPTAGVYGTYRIKHTVDEGLGTEDATIRTFGIRNPCGVLVPAFNEKADEDASLITPPADLAEIIENSENNELSAISGLRWAGWHDFLTAVARKLDIHDVTYNVKHAMNEQASITPVIVGAWKFPACTLKAASSMYIGTDTAAHTVTARLRRAGSPVPIVASWSVLGGLQDVVMAGGVDITISVADWYYLELLSDNIIATALLKGVDIVLQ